MSVTWDTKSLKTTPVLLDEVLLIDTEDSRNQKRATLSSMGIGVWSRNSGSGFLFPATLTDFVGIGTITPLARLNSLSTIEQLRLSYDVTNYTSFTVSSGGDLTIAPTGSDTSITGSLSVVTTTGGFLPPVLTDTQRDAVPSPASGLLIYDISNNDYNFYNGTEWRALLDSSVASFVAGGIAFGSTNSDHSLTDDPDNLFWDDTNNRLGVGTKVPLVNIHSLSTTEQIRLGYDGSNYSSFTISSSGDLTIAPTGGETNVTGNLTSSGIVNAATKYEQGGSTILIGDSTLFNLFTGFSAGAAITTGTSNTAIGHEALTLNTTGFRNTAVGFKSLPVNVGGTSNVAIGYQSLFSNVSGSNNVSIGLNALISNVLGRRNIAIGEFAGLNIVSAVNTGENTLIGYSTGSGITTGVQNTILGANVTGLSGTLSNNIILADGAGVTRLQVNSSGDMGIGLTSSISAKLHVLSTTEQLRLGYDASNYTQFTVDSSGQLAIAITGIDVLKLTEPSINALTILTGINDGENNDFVELIPSGTEASINLEIQAKSGTVLVGTNATSSVSIGEEKLVQINAGTMSIGLGANPSSTGGTMLILEAESATKSTTRMLVRSPSNDFDFEIGANDTVIDSGSTFMKSATTEMRLQTSAGTAISISSLNSTFGGLIDIASGSDYQINSVSVLNATTLGSTVLASSLISLGTLSSLTISGDLTVDTDTLFVDSTNNEVGIGISSSMDAKLHILSTTEQFRLGYNIAHYASFFVNDIDISFSVYDSISLNVSSQDTEMRDLAFNADGTRMISIGATNDSLFQYTLTTAYDISTASYDSVSFSISSQESFATALTFNADGTKMYIVGDNNLTIYQYTLTTGFDITTASLSQSKSVSSEITSFPESLHFTSDGTQMFVSSFSGSTIFKYDLTTGFDISTASYDGTSKFDFSSEISSLAGVVFNSDGSKMFALGFSNSIIFQYSLTTSYDVTTASYDGVSFSVNSEEQFKPVGLEFNADFTKMYLVGATAPNTIYQYSADTGGLTINPTGGRISGPSGTWDSGGMDIASSDTYAINGTDVLNATTLGSTVLASSLTSLGTQSEALDMGTLQINNVSDPTSDQDAATKKYVEDNFGDVTKVGTPVDNQLGIWTGDGTLQGDSQLLYDGSNLTMTDTNNAGFSITGSGTSGTLSIALTNDVSKSSFFGMSGSAASGSFAGITNVNLSRWLSSADNLLIGTFDQASPIIFAVNLVERMRLTSSGLGISDNLTVNTDLLVTSLTGTEESDPFVSSIGQYRSTVVGNGRNAGFLCSSINPSFALRETDQATSEKIWDFRAEGGKLRIGGMNDASNLFQPFIEVTRTSFGMDTTHFTNGTTAFGYFSATATVPLVAMRSSSLTQLHLEYDITNFASFTVDSSGILDIVSSGDNTKADGQTISRIDSDDVHEIFSTAEYEALGTSGIITTSKSTTAINLKTTVTSSTRIVISSRAHEVAFVDDTESNNFIYTGTSTFFTSAIGGDITLDDATMVAFTAGTQLFDYVGDGSIPGVDLVTIGEFTTVSGWSLGTIGRISTSELGPLFSMSGASSLINITSGLVCDSVSIFGVDNVYIDQSDKVGISGPIFTIKDSAYKAGRATFFTLVGSLYASEQLVRIDAGLPADYRVNVFNTNLILNGTATIFDTSGSTGSFSAVANASISSVTITGVSGTVGAVATFTHAGTTPPLGSLVTISGFTTNTTYNTTGIVTASTSTTFQVDYILFVADEASVGSYTVSGVTITATAHGLTIGTGVTLDTTLSTVYDGGFLIYNIQTNSFDVQSSFNSGEISTIAVVSGGTGYTAAETVNITGVTSGATGATGTITVTAGVIQTVTIVLGGTGYTQGESVTMVGVTSGATNATGTATTIVIAGTWSTEGLDQTDPRVLATNNPGTTDSHAIASGFVNDNSTLTSITISAYGAIAVTGFSAIKSELFKLIDSTTGKAEYTGNEPFSGTLNGNLFGIKTGSTANYRFAVSINGAVPAFATAAYIPMEVKTTKVSIPLEFNVELDLGDTVQLMVAGDSTSDSLTITDAMYGLQ